MTNVKIDKFILLLGGILVMIAVMLIFTFRGVFSALSLSYDLGEVDTASELKVNTAKLEEAKNYAFGQRTIVPVNIKDNPRSAISLTPTPNPAR